MQFDEATAILAGDALQTQAFYLLAHADMGNITAERRLAMVERLAAASGSRGMVGGQAIDIASEGKDIPFETLRYLHSCKTGALITAAVQMGAVLGDASNEQYDCFTEYGKNIEFLRSQQW